MPDTRIQLPMAQDRRERADAAANRARIVDAAKRLLTERGPSAVSMDAVAAAAGVGKGTVFRRFGDRAGLMDALVSEYTRHLQDAFLHGPPPLGPGAPAAERIEAFVLALIRLQREHLPLALAAELPGAPPAGAFTSLFAHVRSLLRELDAGLDADSVATLLLGATAPPVLGRLADVPLTQVQAAALTLLRGLTAPGPA